MTDGLRKIGVVGAGQMGSGIAHVCALPADMLICTSSADRLKSSLATISGNMTRQVASQKIEGRAQGGPRPHPAGAEIDALAEVDLAS